MDILKRAVESGADLNAKDFWRQVAMKTRIADARTITKLAQSALKNKGFLANLDGMRAWAEYEKERSRIAFVPEIAAIDDAFLAFGDGMNDLEMLESVGKGFVMGNANPKLKAALPNHDVIGSVDKDAVALKLIEIFLTQN
jgi:phosphoserine phosphatase